MTPEQFEQLLKDSATVNNTGGLVIDSKKIPEDQLNNFIESLFESNGFTSEKNSNFDELIKKLDLPLAPPENVQFMDYTERIEAPDYDDVLKNKLDDLKK